MNQPPTPNPPDDGVDAVPGDPAVPITVWRTPASGDPTPIPDRLAYRLLAAYTTPGDTIIDLTGAPSISATAAAGRRSLVHAGFTRANQLTVTDMTPVPSSRLRTRGGGTAGDPAELGDWFGDDLQHPDRPTTGGRWDTANGPGDTGGRSLLIAPWPLHPSETSNTQRLAVLAAAAAQVLQPGGCVVFIATSDRAHRGAFTTVVTAAATAGLRYLQHIVAVGADIDGDQLTYHGTDHDLAEPHAGRHRRVHTDLLVFERAQTGYTDG